MENVFVVVAEENGYCSDHWVIGVFSTSRKAREWRDAAQACADVVYKKIRALGEEEGPGATWRDVCMSAEWEVVRAGWETSDWFDAVKELKRQVNPYDPDMEVGWDCIMHYTVQEWSVDSRDVVGHRRTRF